MAKPKPAVMYGIKNCDTIKKARAWMEAHEIAYTFRDYKMEGVDAARIEAWIATAGLEVVLNKASTTFKALPEKQKAGLTQKRAVALMVAQPSMIKRPVLEAGAAVLVGFKPDAYAAALLSKRG